MTMDLRSAIRETIHMASSMSLGIGSIVIISSCIDFSMTLEQGDIYVFLLLLLALRPRYSRAPTPVDDPHIHKVIALALNLLILWC